MSIPGMSAAILGVGVGSLPDMFIPGMSAAILGVGVGSLPDMFIPGMSAAILGVGVGSLPDMFIPAMPPELLLDCALPASSNDVDLDSNAITAAKMATATPTDEITARLVPVLRAIEKSSQVSSCHAGGMRKTCGAQVSMSTLFFAPRDFPGDFGEGSVKTAHAALDWSPNLTM